METQEADEFVYSEDSAKRVKMAAEPDSDGQLYSCEQCEKSFSKQSSLARHRYEHSGDLNSESKFGFELIGEAKVIMGS